ncbi:DUF58 domain-containing protein [Roseofilum casamattae]|uniref:DUF58 domain-containing protein n=1 Tax=Roseofilum casamattae BLCC-M143 TaxID=3022442 RepID=A0ABT7BW18_9CYAN|nr:DUF58 domain-containing protein [Roseofilum casamattae]MDJ1183384.1 DUF58 domain-containing protein [Roseofilum casamattae BLCC-M143]
MTMMQAIADWLERKWVAPAYAGWLLSALAIFFFGAATNTMVGWLYVISGILGALLFMAAVLSLRSLRGIRVLRHRIRPVSAGEYFTLEIEIENRTSQPKTLLQARDVFPLVLGKPRRKAIAYIAPHGSYKWVYEHQTEKRGIYRWNGLQLRSAAPLGLFWCRRQQDAPAMAIVYPQVLPLRSCPLIDELGQQDTPQLKRDRQSVQNATEGLTRSLRPYRVGDPMRLIHWRSSARYGDLRVRELEAISGGEDAVIALDTEFAWEPEAFEQAVIAAASLFFYASRKTMNVRLWTANTGLVQGHQVVLEVLAGTTFGEPTRNLPHLPLVWLTGSRDRLNQLPAGSRWVLWSAATTESQQSIAKQALSGIEIVAEKSLESQLQQPMG